MDALGFIMAAESGDIDSAEGYIDGMATLIKSGTVWGLQGSWQRAAANVIEQGYVSPEGEVLAYPEAE